jgi:hypothetical protein
LLDRAKDDSDVDNSITKHSAASSFKFGPKFLMIELISEEVNLESKVVFDANSPTII